MLREIPASDTLLRTALLAEKLPTDDLGRRNQRFFAWEDDDGRVVAHGGLEGRGADRLLRSLVVSPGERGKGLAVRLVAALEHVARSGGAERLWLLTETAGPVFDRLGWRRAERDTAPDEIAGSAQFAALCPASAVCMVRDLTS
ncbi:MAG: arsenic resistance N-acetyltransferase ArsN2 [Siculibacillus sp.]|nr:arsenic resistance N-acetyltransferase ArsN2 [Siculibacillus sp.]